MHLLARDLHGLDDAGAAADLEQTPADIVFLSFSDSELQLVAQLHEDGGNAFASLRCAPLSLLKHPYSVDLYIEKVARHARVIIARLLGGKDYWSYGVDELARIARETGAALALVPGDALEDPRLDAASTLPRDALRRIWSYFHNGGPDNIKSLIGEASTRAGRPAPFAECRPVASAGHYVDAQRQSGARRALIVFYRSAFLANDAAPIIALADALNTRGFCVDALFVASLKDPDSIACLAQAIDTARPDVILNATAFSARDHNGSVLERADAPIFQVALATSSREAWLSSPRGANGADLAMNIVLPEVDGRIFTRAISFKAPSVTRASSQYRELRHRPESSRVDFVADLAANWARLRAKDNADKRLALILSDYPARRGRGGYAIGLDAEQSLYAIVADLRAAGFAVNEPPQALIRTLETGAQCATFPLAEYQRLFDALPASFCESVAKDWGAAEDDPAVADGAFRFSCIESGAATIAFQPDRGARAERRESYHDSARAPRHAYVAFYLWLRFVKRIDALVHIGTHGTLEWLPGKSAMLTPDCAVEAVLGPTPMIYPFIVNDPGEAAQAKRRAAAVAIGHLTPPLVDAGLYPGAARIEALLDEYSSAAQLDPRRAAVIAGAVLDEAESCGLLSDCGATKDDAFDALAKLDAFLCDVKEMRIGDGLHVFGRAVDDDPMRALCATRESAALLAALDGRFIEPGPAGAPSRRRIDVLPTGRNLFCIDPRHAPTRTAYDIGKRAAREIMLRHAQEHGDWPRAVMLDLWGSATIRTGGEDFAQALALLGVAPTWDAASARVSGFEIEPLAKRDFPRVDVTLHISGVFRDMFPGLIALFDDAVRAVAMLDEDPSENPLVAARGDLARIFGAAPGAYGLGVAEHIARGDWTTRDDLGATFLASAGCAFNRDGEGAAALEAFRARVRGAQALLHTQDMADVDLFAGAAFAEFEGGFAAANRMLGGAAEVVHIDATRDGGVRARGLATEMARVLRARLANPRWLAGQMRHGHRGAGEIAEGVDNFYAFAATTGLASDAQFDLLFSATLGDDALRDFLARENPRALHAIADVFAQAQARGLWRSRRNSVAATLAAAQEHSA
jgi:cobaltochelatase CobN